jgi:hypothetical protein
VRRPGAGGGYTAIVFVLASAAYPALAASTLPAPRAARLEGVFMLSGRVTVADNVRGEHVRERVRRVWAFWPLCPAGSCARVELVRTRAGGVDKLILDRRAPAYYVGTGRFYAPLRCANRVYRKGEAVRFKITVRVTAAEIFGTTVLARHVRAFYTNRGRRNLTPCVAAPSHDAAVYRGTVASPPPAADHHDQRT